MRWALLALCACNSIYGLHDVGERDAKPIDAVPDAQPYCPPMGVVPRFSPVIHQAINQNCSEYTTSAQAGFAIAMCMIDPLHLYFGQGPIDQPLSVATGFPTFDQTVSLTNLRLAPEGDTAYVDVLDLTNIVTMYESYVYIGGNAWSRGPDLPFTGFGAPSVPSRGPVRHMLFENATSAIEEWSDAGGTWHQLRTFDVGNGTVRSVWLAPDGLRAVALTNPTSQDLELRYFDRGDIDAQFNPAMAFDTLPSVRDLFITEDCTRAYMSSVESIFYAVQI